MKTARIIASAILASLLALAPASADIYNWSQTAITNTNSDLSDDINLVEGMAPSEVNDSMRALMSEVRKWVDDMGASKPSAALMSTAGSANVQTLTTNGTAPALTHGHTVCFIVGSGLTNTSSVTLNVDTFGAKAVQGIDGTALSGGELAAGTLQCATYQATDQVWLLHQFKPVDGVSITATSAGLAQRAALTGDVTATAGLNATTIANDAVTTAKVDDDAITSAKIINDAVTYAKMQNVSATDRFLGRDTASAGDVEEIAPAAAVQILCGADPGADRIYFWDDSETACGLLAVDSTLTISATTLSRAALTGDVTTSGNAATIAADAVALGTDTTGSYAAGDAEGGAATSGDSATSFFSTGTLDDARIDGTAEVDEIDAVQADQETSTSTTTFVTPAVQENHPSAAKCWGYVTVSGGVPTLAANYNVSGITDSGTGVLTVDLTTSFSSVNYAVVATVNSVASVLTNLGIKVTITDANTFVLRVEEGVDGDDFDPSGYSFSCFGDQ
jgi:hypothetical protein